eukprot:COSAG01_NODE_15057_length_1379_cov_1.438281_1_plen_289_part_10
MQLDFVSARADHSDHSGARVPARCSWYTASSSEASRGAGAIIKGGAIMAGVPAGCGWCGGGRGTPLKRRAAPTGLTVALCVGCERRLDEALAVKDQYDPCGWCASLRITGELQPRVSPTGETVGLCEGCAGQLDREVARLMGTAAAASPPRPPRQGVGGAHQGVQRTEEGTPPPPLSSSPSPASGRQRRARARVPAPAPMPMPMPTSPPPSGTAGTPPPSTLSSRATPPAGSKSSKAKRRAEQLAKADEERRQAMREWRARKDAEEKAQRKAKAQAATKKQQEEKLWRQ